MPRRSLQDEGATTIGTVLAAGIGISSAYFGGIVDIVLQRVIEIWQTFPGVIFVIFVISILARVPGALS